MSDGKGGRFGGPPAIGLGDPFLDALWNGDPAEALRIMVENLPKTHHHEEADDE